MTDLRKMCQNPPSLPPRKCSYYPGKGGKKWLTCKKCVKILRPYPLEKVFYCLGQGGKNTDLQKVCEKPPSLLSRNIFVLFFVQEKGFKMTDMTPLERDRMTTAFRFTSLASNLGP